LELMGMLANANFMSCWLLTVHVTSNLKAELRCMNLRLKS
jgi:hypothetical protein